jgi:hypothetical protein
LPLKVNVISREQKPLIYLLELMTLYLRTFQEFIYKYQLLMDTACTCYNAAIAFAAFANGTALKESETSEASLPT